MTALRTLAALAAAAVLSLHAEPSMPSRLLAESASLDPAWRAPAFAPFVDVAHLPPLPQKAAMVDEGGRLQVGPVRPIERMAQPLAWWRVPGGYATRFRVTSDEALGLRIRLALEGVPGAIELRARGADGRVETQWVDPALGPEAWSPWTEGDAQDVELFSPVLPSPGAVAASGVVHTAVSPLGKLASSCTIPTTCLTGDPVLDSAVAEAKKAIAKISFVEAGRGYVCTATLVNTELFPAAYLLTANHCIHSPEVAATLTTLWFYESPTCSPVNPSFSQVQVSGGSALVFTGYSVDATMLLMNQPPPAGTVYAGWSGLGLAKGASFVSLSHPAGDTARIARGTIDGNIRFSSYPQSMYLMLFTSGVTEGGSSGSGVFALNGTQLELRAVMHGHTVGDSGPLSCTTVGTERGLSTRLDVFIPQVSPYITRAGRAADDAPNRIADYPAGVDAPLDANGRVFQRSLEYAGDVDLIRFQVAASTVVAASTEGANIDTVGTLLDATGTEIAANDDAQRDDNHFGITRALGPGTYYLAIEHFLPTGVGAYTARLRTFDVDPVNYTNLWWNAAEPGWGLNVNHQGNTLFATLFTYDRDGSPMWLVMSGGARQADGSFTGALYRSRGPAFNSVPWGPVSLTQVGSMTLRFASAQAGTLSYSFDGTTVTKAITPQAFSTVVPTCGWSAFDRTYSFVLQDLWWDPAESGWGLNLAHQGDKLFATLFTYEAGGKGVWFVMSEGTVTREGFTGALYRTSGRSFDASPWIPATVTPVGTFSAVVNDGNSLAITYTVDGVTVNKNVRRQVFSMPRAECRY